MNSSEILIADKIIVKKSTSLCDLFFTETLVVVEFYEGVHLSYKNSVNLVEFISNHYGNNKPFGVISNMVNPYSISPMDIQKIKTSYTNMISYGVVTYSKASRMMAEIENRFCENDNICYNSLDEAIEHVNLKLKGFNQFSKFNFN